MGMTMTELPLKLLYSLEDVNLWEAVLGRNNFWHSFLFYYLPGDPKGVFEFLGPFQREV
jgi:hypothetical protein